MLKLTASGSYTITTNKDSRIVINDEESEWEVIPGIQNNLILKSSNRVLHAECIEKSAKSMTIKIGHQLYTFQIQTKLDLLMEKMGLNDLIQSGPPDLKAPMPGLILDIRVQKGDQVKKGDVLLVLEAMKMENVIKAESDAEVVEILAAKGESVEKNQILIKF